MTVARQVRRSIQSGSNWSRTGMNLEISFEDSLGTDTSPVGLNSLVLTNSSIVAGINGLALDTQTVGYATKTGITADIKTTAGTLHIYFKRTDTSKSQYISFTTNGSVGSELWVSLRNSAGSFPNAIQIAVIDGGVNQLNYITGAAITNTDYHLITITGDGSEYLMYVDGSPIAITNKISDPLGYRGAWSGSPLLAPIDSFSIGGILRSGMTSNDGSGIYEFVKMYDYAQTATEIADLYSTIGGEK